MKPGRSATLALALAAAPWSFGEDAPHLLLRARLRNPPTLASIQNPVFPGSIPEGDTTRVGSIFSGLFRSPNDPPDAFWATIDRGPNDGKNVHGEWRTTFSTPAYAPAIFRVRVDRGSGEIRIDRTIYLRTKDGKPLSGLPNRAEVDETPWDSMAQTRLDFDPGGIDAEAVVRAPDGTFWLAEEYGPSLVHVAEDGHVLARYVPEGSGIAVTGYPVLETLPKPLHFRQKNRGFEALAISRDGSKLFALVQSPLAHPVIAASGGSRIIRLAVVDAASGKVIGAYGLVADAAEAYQGTKQSEVKVGDAAWVNDQSLLMVERTDTRARVYLLDLSKATNLLDDPMAAGRELEIGTPEALAALGIGLIRKTLVADLSSLVPDLPEKIEGLAILDANTIVVGNDNEFAARGKSEDSQLFFVHLPKPLPLPPVDVHTLASVNEVWPTHLSLDLTLDFATRRIRGTNQLTLAYAEGPAPAHLDLDTSELRIARVVDPGSGRELSFTLDAPVRFLGRRLRIDLGGARPARLRVEYETSPGASALQWLTPQQTSSGKLPFLFTQSQAIHARSWIPCADSPGTRITYDAVVRVPPGTRVVMSAEHLSHDPAQGLFRFRMSEPIPPYLMALAAGELGFEPLGPRTGVYAEPTVLARAASEFRDVEKMLEAAEELYGPYPWGRWDTIVLPPSFPFGGMENPRLTFATPTIIAGDRSLVDVMAHELAHSWSGNLVTNATWSDFWLNEGFTTYIENRLVERLYGKDLAEMQALLQIRQLRKAAAEKQRAPGDTQLAQELRGRNPDDAGSVAYEKGSSLLRVLEKHFGRERLDAFLRGYFAGNAFHSMTTGRFLELLRAGLFKDEPAAWDALHVEEWVYGRGIPDNLVEPRSQRFANTRAAAEAFVKAGATEGIRAEWLTVEWLDFLGALPKPLSRAQMEALDRNFGFTTRGNSEVLFAWLEHAVAASYEPAFPAIERFLTSMGRRKFLEPLYEDLDANPKTRDLARRIYAKARPTYHPIAVATIDAILKWSATP